MLVCTCFFFACLFWCVSAVLMSVFFCAGAGVLLFWCWCVHATGVYISAVLVIVCFCADTCMLRRYTHTHSCAISFCAVCVCALTDPPLTHSLTHSLPSLCVMRDFFLRGVWCLACVCICVCVWCVACACACVCVWCVACASWMCMVHDMCILCSMCMVDVDVLVVRACVCWVECECVWCMCMCMVVHDMTMCMTNKQY